MGLFSTILEKLGLKHPAEQAAPAKPAAAEAQPAPQIIPDHRPAPPNMPPAAARPAVEPPAYAKPITTDSRPAPQSVSPIPPAASVAPAAIPMVDVVSKLEHLAAANPQKLDWKVSIVDLLKLLDIDSSYEARKGLAIELGCPAEKMGDSAQMNVWLHKTVLQKLADNGGNIPKELLD